MARQTVQSLQFAIIQCYGPPSPIQSLYSGPQILKRAGLLVKTPLSGKPCRILPCWLPRATGEDTTPHHTHITSLQPGTSKASEDRFGSCGNSSSLPGALIPAQCYSLARVEVSPLALPQITSQLGTLPGATTHWQDGLLEPDSPRFSSSISLCFFLLARPTPNIYDLTVL